MVTATELNYKNFGRCVKLDNGTASIIITVEVGPRIISYCLNGHENMLLEDAGREFKDASVLNGTIGEMHAKNSAIISARAGPGTYTAATGSGAALRATRTVTSRITSRWNIQFPAAK